MDSRTEITSENKKTIHFPYFSKMKGTGNNPLQVNVMDSFTVLIGGTLTIVNLIYLENNTSSCWC